MKLDVSEATKLMANRAGKRFSDISEELGFNSSACVLNMLTRKSLKADVSAEIAEVCGYKLMYVPKGQEIEGGIEIAG